LPIVTRHGGSVAKAYHHDLSRHCERSEAIHMTSRRSQLQEDTYFRVLRMLQDNPDMTQREIAEKLGISTSGLNYCLKALIDKGWVKVHNFSQSKNKFGYIYVLTPQGIAEKAMLAGRFLKRKMTEYEQLQAEIEMLKAEMGSMDTDGQKVQNA
jgi:EPS-associated MarR family transcriptional regulator